MTRPGEQLPHELEVVLGATGALGRRREPRVRFVKGRPGRFLCFGTRRTRRAAFRAAREAREAGERRPIRVWPQGGGFAFGVSLATPF